MEFTVGEISRSVSSRKYADEGQAALAHMQAREILKGLCILILLSGQEFKLFVFCGIPILALT